MLHRRLLAASLSVAIVVEFGLSLAPAVAHADAAQDAAVRDGPYSGTARYELPWRPENTELPGGCLGETRRGDVYVREGTVAPNSFGDMVRCTRDPARR